MVNTEPILSNMGPQTFYVKRPHTLLWASSRTARGNTTISGTPNCLNYYEILIAGCIHSLQMWLWARVGDSWF